MTREQRLMSALHPLQAGTPSKRRRGVIVALLASLGRTTLAARMLFGVGGFALLCFLVLSAIQLKLEQKALGQASHDAAMRVVMLSQEPLALAVWNYDAQIVRMYAHSLVSGDAIARVEVVDTEGRPLVDASGPWAAKTPAKWELPLTAPVGATRVGTLRVYEPSDRLAAQLWHRAAIVLPVELLKVVCISVGILILMHLLVTRRLTTLVVQLRARTPGGDYTEIRPVGRCGCDEDEIGTLTESINRFLRDEAEIAQLRRQREAAEATSKARNEFLSRMSHELRTPLNAIVGFAQVLGRDALVMADQQRRLQVDRIVRAGWHLDNLIGDVLDLSRIESGRMQVSLGTVDLEDVAHESTALVCQDAGTEGVGLAVEVEGDARYVEADPTRLKQVLVNLLSNAVKYNRRGGSVLVACTALADRTVQISVHDDGLGMTHDQLAHLFEPFNRVGRQASGKPGTGIGLVIAKALVEAMGGSLQAHSQPGRGSEFRVHLRSAEAPGNALPCSTGRGGGHGTSRLHVHVEAAPGG